ncbi:cyclophilin-like fold protein [Rhizobium leguminosarum]|uniref:cyclophilin-like fold protein n=1 Tax=Rhizobium leguminosarum TaxID=384 RepID=UPI003F98EE3A
MITRRRNILLGIGAAMTVPNAGLGQQPAQVNGNSSTAVRVRFTFGDSTMTATLDDSPPAGDFASMLPLDLTIEDYSHNEKIVRLLDNERPGDLCYFKPWGNLALFYGGYKWDGLIRLGRFEDGFDPLRIRGNFSVRIERA